MSRCLASLWGSSSAGIEPPWPGESCPAFVPQGDLVNENGDMLTGRLIVPFYSPGGSAGTLTDLLDQLQT